MSATAERVNHFTIGLALFQHLGNRGGEVFRDATRKQQRLFTETFEVRFEPVSPPDDAKCEKVLPAELLEGIRSIDPPARVSPYSNCSLSSGQSFWEHPLWNLSGLSLKRDGGS